MEGEKEGSEKNKKIPALFYIDAMNTLKYLQHKGQILAPLEEFFINTGGSCYP